MDPSAPPIVVRESRWKTAGLAFGASLFVWILVLPDGNSTAHDGTRYFVLLAIGLVDLFFIAQVFRPATLTLDPNGFKVDTLFRNWSVPWERASNFRIANRSRSFTRYIAYDHKPDAFGSAGYGRWGELPSYWTLSPPRLLELMNQCKASWGPDGPQAKPLSFGADEPAASRPSPPEPPPPPVREPTVT